MTDPRFPIGNFQPQASYSAAEKTALLEVIARTPQDLRAALEGLTEAQLETPYRDGGWTLRQVAHHVPDSHINAYVRTKLALTEDAPIIKPYDEAGWALLEDTKAVPLEVSLRLLEAIHTRWVVLLQSLQPSDWARTYQHPVSGAISLERMLALYAWHGQHHVAHVTSLRKQKNW